MAKLLRVVAALVFVQVAIGVYATLTKSAVDDGLDPGLFVLVRDANTSWIVLLWARRATGTWGLPRPPDRFAVTMLGLLGLYFGQYFAVVGLKHGNAVLSTVWANLNPVATYLLGFAIGAERLIGDRPTGFKLAGVALAVIGAVYATVGPPDPPSHPGPNVNGSVAGDGAGDNGSPVNASGGVTLALLHSDQSVDGGVGADPGLASVFFCLQVLLGGAVFWHLQKRLLCKGYPPIQIVAWYYSSGVAMLALVVLPNTTKAMWTLSHTDLVALGYGVALWPVAAYLLTYANDNASPVTVMAFAPLQIVVTIALGYVTEGVVPTIHEAVGAAFVTVGLGCFVTGTMLQARRQSGDADVADGGDGGGSLPAAGSGEIGAAVVLNESVALLGRGSIQVTK